MTTMMARWSGRCRRCGKAIAQGSPIEWSKDTGTVHASPEACERASPVALRGPQPERPEDRARVESLLAAHLWRPATSERYRSLPHEYTVKARHWLGEEADFLWCVEYIRRVGYEKYFIGRTWVYYDIGPDCFWDCGGPVAEVGVINRAVRRRS